MYVIIPIHRLRNSKSLSAQGHIIGKWENSYETYTHLIQSPYSKAWVVNHHVILDGLLYKNSLKYFSYALWSNSLSLNGSVLGKCAL